MGSIERRTICYLESNIRPIKTDGINDILD